MFLLKKMTVWCGICAAVLALNACASAVFPDFEDDGEIMVSEGGRIVRKIPKEGSSLRADTENAAYEEDDEDLNDSVEEIVAEEEVEAAKSTPVAVDEIGEEPMDEDEEQQEADATPDVDALIGVQAVGPSVSYRLDTFYFDNGSAVLSGKYNSSLRKIVREAKANNASVIVYGHSSSRTRNTDPASHKLANFKISLERAQSVAAALRRAGMPADKIVVEALSDSAPAYQEVMPEGERLNRRAEVYIAY